MASNSSKKSAYIKMLYYYSKRPHHSFILQLRRQLCKPESLSKIKVLLFQILHYHMFNPKCTLSDEVKMDWKRWWLWPIVWTGWRATRTGKGRHSSMENDNLAGSLKSQNKESLKIQGVRIIFSMLLWSKGYGRNVSWDRCSKDPCRAFVPLSSFWWDFIITCEGWNLNYYRNYSSDSFKQERGTKHPNQRSIQNSFTRILFRNSSKHLQCSGKLGP